MGLSVENSNGRMLAKLLREGALRSFAKCIRESDLAKRSHRCDEDTWLVVVKSEFISEAYCPTLGDYDRVGNKIRILRPEDCKMQEQKVCASLNFAA